MKMKVTRRDVLTLAGGGVAGILLTPAPWKLIDDLAIWTQNWKWIPRPPKGPETIAATACSLCPAGCPVDARCIGGLPVSLRPAAGGTLCALGITGHHLPWHPARLEAPVRIEGGSPAPAALDEIVALAARAMRDAATHDGEVAVLDMRPGRSLSWAWRRLLGQLPHGSVVPPPGGDGSSLGTLASMTNGASEIGIDLSVPRAILSFGAPLGEGPGRARIISNSVPLIQVEPVRSRTAEIADRWLPCRPGGEGSLALALANVLLGERLVDEAALRSTSGAEEWIARAAATAPEAVAAETGLAPEVIRATARELAAARPALAIPGEQPGGGRHGAAVESAIFALNLLLGGIERGAFVERGEIPAPFDAAPLAPVDELARLEDRSLALLIVDASAGDAVFPWALVERKLAPGAPVIALSPFLAGSATRADYVVPTAPFLEALQELTSAPEAPAATFALSVPLLPARQTTIDPATFIRSLAQSAGIAMEDAWTSTEDLARKRAAAIHRSGRGSITDRAGTTRPIASVATADEMWDALTAGGGWVDDQSKPLALAQITLPAPVPAPEPGFSAIEPGSTRLALLPILSSDARHSAAMSPLMTKLYRESSLRPAARTALVNPKTARTLALRDGDAATLRTDAGEMKVTVATDERVLPGVVAAIVGPEREAMGGRREGARIIDLCPTDSNGIWRQSSAALLEG